MKKSFTPLILSLAFVFSVYAGDANAKMDAESPHSASSLYVDSEGEVKVREITDGSGAEVPHLPFMANTADRSLAIGEAASVSGKKALAVGFDSKVTGHNSSAFGQGSSAFGVNSLALGTEAFAQGLESIAIGAGARATGLHSIAIGAGVRAMQPWQIVIGKPAHTVWIPGDVRVGNLAVSGLENGIVMSNGGKLEAVDGLVFTRLSNSSGDGQEDAKDLVHLSLHNGTRLHLEGNTSVAAGQSAGASGEEEILIAVGQIHEQENPGPEGGSSTGSTFGAGNGSSVVRTYRAAGDPHYFPFANDQSVAVGERAYATSPNSIAIGYDSKACGTRDEHGNLAEVPGCADGATAVGYSAEAQANYSSAYGFNASAFGEMSVGIGAVSNASGIESVAIGGMAQAMGDHSIAVGIGAMATGANSVAIGMGAMATQTNSIAIGSGARATAENQIVLGGTEHTVVSPKMRAPAGANAGAMRLVTVDNQGAFQALDSTFSCGSGSCDINIAGGGSGATTQQFADFESRIDSKIDTRLNSFSDRIDRKVDKKIDSALAISAALAMLGNPDPGKRFSISAGMGVSGSEAAFAGGMSVRIIDTPKIGAVFKGGAGFAPNATSAGGAFTFSF